MTSSESDSRWPATWLRRIAVGGAGLGGILLLLTVGIRVFCDAEYVESRLNRALDGTAARAYRVDVGSIRWGLWLGSVQLGRVAVRHDSAAVRGAPTGEGAEPGVFATIPAISVEGIRLWPLLWRRFSVSTVRVQAPRVRLSGGETLGDGLGSSSSRDSSETGPSSGAAQEQEGGPRVFLERIEVRDGMVSVVRNDAPADSLWGVTATFDRGAPTSLGELDLDRLLGGRARLSFDGYRRVFPDRLYVIRLGLGQFAATDSTLRVDSLAFVPTVPDSVFVRRRAYRTNRFLTRAKRVEARGVDARRFLEEGAVIAEAVRIEAGTLDVYRDNHRPPEPDDPPPPMPNEVVRTLDRPLRVDTIRVTASGVRYAKRKENVPEPGAISFENLWASLYNVTNDPQRMTRSTPAVIDARTDVAGAGRLHTTIRLPLLTEGVFLSYEGRLGAMDARAFNETFVNLAGVRVEQGQVDSLWFEAEVADGRATGSVQGVYRNLEVETLDPTTGNRGLKNRLKTLIVNGLGVRSNVVPGDGPLRTGRIEFEYEEDMTFFKFLWQSLRSGIYNLVGLDRLPR